MPLKFIKNLSNNSKLGIWELSESIRDLEAVYPLSDTENKTYTSFRNEKRKCEWLTARILLTEILEFRPTILYTENGKPYLKDININISITHSKNHVAIITSETFNPGIDIEHIAPRVEKVKNKFLQTEELEWCNSHELMTICWSAKEAIFKIFEKDLGFHDILISKFSHYDNFLEAQIFTGYPKKFRVYFEQINEDVLTYTFELN